MPGFENYTKLRKGVNNMDLRAFSIKATLVMCSVIVLIFTLIGYLSIRMFVPVFTTPGVNSATVLSVSVVAIAIAFVMASAITALGKIVATIFDNIFK